jgi:hypothetical protein
MFAASQRTAAAIFTATLPPPGAVSHDVASLHRNVRAPEAVGTSNTTDFLRPVTVDRVEALAEPLCRVSWVATTSSKQAALTSWLSLFFVQDKWPTVAAGRRCGSGRAAWLTNQRTQSAPSIA